MPELDDLTASTGDAGSQRDTAGHRSRNPRSAGLARVTQRKPSDVHIRRRPTQARGAATFDAILEAAARLLIEHGHEILTTNLVARVAGVNIATLYQYFPSKESILLALFQRDTDSRMAAGMEPVQRAHGADDWRQVVSGAVDILVHARRMRPETAALRRAMRSLPELQEYERVTMAASVEMVAEALVRRTGMDAARAAVISSCGLETATALLDLWSLGYAGGMGNQDDRIVQELKVMLIAYLAPHLDPRP